jgi:uncharacterized lipoprotein YmbA
MKNLFSIALFALLINGCSSKEYYTLGDTSAIMTTVTYPQSIAVEKVDVPKYLKDNAIVRQVSPYQVIRLKNANWLTPMQKRLTNVLISYLQKSLNNPNIYLYPWESKKETNKKVSLKIQRFISYKNYVILEASYQITNLKTKAHQTKLFSTKVATTEEVESMMESMEKAYFKLIKEIKKNIIK